MTSNTKAIIVNSPNNPSGLVYPDELIVARWSSSARRKGIYLIMDDIYHKLVFDGVRPSPGAGLHDRADIESTKVIVVNGVSKLYGMTGFRIGWTVAPQGAGADHDQRAGADHLVRVARSCRRRRGRADRACRARSSACG